MKNNKEIALSVKNLSIGYKERNRPFSKTIRVLEDINMELYKGETLGLYGHNGAGKSTLLTALAGIIKPDRGYVNSYDNNISLLNLNLGMDSSLSGRENIILHGMFLGFSYKEIIHKIEEIIDFTELRDFIDKPLYTYSSGMKARLGFATVYQLKTDIILIDEMLAVGDQHFRQKSNYAIKHKIKSNQTIVLVTHNIPQLKHLSDRIVCLEKGRVTSILEKEEFNKIEEVHNDKR